MRRDRVQRELIFDRPADLEDVDIGLSIVIVNWNAGEYIGACLESVFRTDLDTTIEVFVVDNASRDGSPEEIAARFPQVNLVENDRNLGFAAAANQAIELARGRSILLLNPDSRLEPECVDRLIEFATHHPDVGIVGPKVLNTDGTLQYSCRRFPTIRAGFFRNTFLGRLFPANPHTRDYLMTDWDHENFREVDWVSGAALLIRRETVEEIGLLDEGYFMYCEDTDWCYRAKRQGWRTFYHPYARVVHRKGASSDKAQYRCVVRHHRSLYRFFRKFYAQRYFVALRWAVAVLLAVRAATIMTKIVGRTIWVRIIPGD
jgi:GT2 family glycosyltransferase